VGDKTLVRGIVAVVTIIAYWTLRVGFNVPLDAMIAGLIAVVIAYVIGGPIGILVGWYLSHDSDVDTTPFKIIAGVNLVAWLIPVVGFAVSAVTFQFSRRSNSMPIAYWILAAIGGWGALGNAGYSGANELRVRQSRERCLEGAPSSWSRQDAENLCLRGIAPTVRMPAA